MQDPIYEDVEQVSSRPSRVRSKNGGISFRTWLLISFLGISTSALLAPLFLPILDRSKIVHVQVDQRFEEHIQTISALTEYANQLKQELVVFKTKQHQDAIASSIDTLSKRISPLLSSWAETETKTLDNKTLKVLQSTNNSFQDLAVIDSSTKQVLYSGSSKKTGAFNEVFPDLHIAYKTNKKSPELSKPGWHWRIVGSDRFILAFIPNQLPTEKQALNIDNDFTQLVETKKATQSLFQTLTMNFWLLIVLVPALGLFLALLVFLRLRSTLITPVQQISQTARQVVDKPLETSTDSLPSRPLTSDLSSTLYRIQDKLILLDQLEQSFNKSRQGILELSNTIGRAASGDLGLRANTTSDELNELTFAINRLLDSIAEKWEAVRQSSLHLKSSSEQLNILSTQFDSMFPSTKDRPHSYDTSLAEILEVQFMTLYDSIRQFNDITQEHNPNKWSSQDKESSESILGSAQVGLRLLLQRTNSAKNLSNQVQSLRQNIEVLSTNLAIATEAKSLNQIKVLANETRTLSRDTNDIAESLTSDLENISNSAKEVMDSFNSVSENIDDYNSLFEEWESFRNTFNKQRQDTLRQIDLLRPAAKTLGTNVRGILDELSEHRDSFKLTRDSISKYIDYSGALTKTIDEIVRLLEQIKTDKPSPAAITKRLSQHRKALEQAVTDLTELAASGGIEILSSETNTIIDNIRQSAEKARKCIQLSNPNDSTKTDQAAGSRNIDSPDNDKEIIFDEIDPSQIPIDLDIALATDDILIDDHVVDENENANIPNSSETDK
jgi:methyl-accepting chemotaxis protein